MHYRCSLAQDRLLSCTESSFTSPNQQYRVRLSSPTENYAAHGLSVNTADTCRVLTYSLNTFSSPVFAFPITGGNETRDEDHNLQSSCPFTVESKNVDNSPGVSRYCTASSTCVRLCQKDQLASRKLASAQSNMFTATGSLLHCSTSPPALLHRSVQLARSSLRLANI